MPSQREQSMPYSQVNTAAEPDHDTRVMQNDLLGIPTDAFCLHIDAQLKALH